MPEELRNIGEEYQRLSKDGFDAALRSFAEVNNGFQVLTAEMTDYSKKTFDDSVRAWEQMIGAKSVGQMIEIQSQFAKRAYDSYMSQISKLGDMCVSMARSAYKPVEQARVRNAP